MTTLPNRRNNDVSRDQYRRRLYLNGDAVAIDERLAQTIAKVVDVAIELNPKDDDLITLR